MDNTIVGLQMNMRQLLNVLSSSLYKGDILSVATRELLQNSFDAVKKVSDPKIQVNFSCYERTLEFKDNGIGMSPDTVKDIFLTIGGTAKEGLDESERAKKMAQEKEDGKDSCIKFINKTSRTFTHKDHEKFSKIASIVYDAIYEQHIRDTFSKTVSTAGVIIDDDFGGMCLTLGGVTGVYINPISIHQNANHFANRMMEILIHELAHGKYSCHSDAFFDQMAIIRNIMWKYNLYEKWHAKFMEIYLQYNNNEEEVIEPSSTNEEDEFPF